MEIISGDKFKKLQGAFYHSMDDLWAKLPRPSRPYIYITHAGDVPITWDNAEALKDPNLIHWYATNAGIQHEKLTAIPAGIEYDLRQAQRECFDKIMAAEIPRSENLYLGCFALHSWVEERHRCLAAMSNQGLQMLNRVSYEQYLIELRRHRFVLCPIGNGIDTFRLWEALYMGCIPIITKRINKERVLVEQYQHDNIYSRIPKIKLDAWEDFNPEILNEQLYNCTYFKSEILDFNFWKKKITNHLMTSHII